MLNIICCEELTHSLRIMAFNSAKIAQLISPMSQIIEKLQRRLVDVAEITASIEFYKLHIIEIVDILFYLK